MSRKYTPHYAIGKEMQSQLTEFRLQKGLFVHELCEATGVSPGEYTALNNGMKSPLLEKTGQPRGTAQRLADFFGVDVVDIWPAYFCRIDETINAEDVIAALHGGLVSRTPEEILEQKELNELYVKAWVFATRNVPIKYMPALLKYIGSIDDTLGSIGETLGMTKERVRQIGAGMHRRLMHGLYLFRRSISEEIMK